MCVCVYVRACVCACVRARTEVNPVEERVGCVEHAQQNATINQIAAARSCPAYFVNVLLSPPLALAVFHSARPGDDGPPHRRHIPDISGTHGCFTASCPSKYDTYNDILDTSHVTRHSEDL